MAAAAPLDRSGGLDVLPVLENNGLSSADLSHHHSKGKVPSEQIRLPPELEQELRDLRMQFTVDTSKLKQIVQQFEAELVEGLGKPRQNIVRLINLSLLWGGERVYQ